MRLNYDSPYDRGGEMIEDIPLLYIEQSPSFWIERNDQEEECLKSLFKYAWLQIWATLPDEKSDKVKTENFAFVFSSMLHRVLQYVDVNQSPRISRDKIDSTWEKGFLRGEKTVRQVCLNDQRFNVNVVMYNSSLIRVMVLTWSRIVLLQELVINLHHERVTIWIC